MSKPVHAIKNQYRGINAHLHSQLQQSGWSDFHARHIIHIADTLKLRLRGMGYTVGIEESLQIKRLPDIRHQPESDVLIYARQPAPVPSGPEAVMDVPVTIAELLAEGKLAEKPFRSIVISEVKATRAEQGKPVAWLELLSPSNKGNSEDARWYQLKRLEILAAGLVFVEMDYLHETPPTFPTLPDYRSGQPEASAYRIIILDPREKGERGPAWVKRFGVDEKIPPVIIPLAGNDTLEFDFGVPYAKTFEEGFLGDNVDYAELPVHFDRYTLSDRTRIARRMLAILEAVQSGGSLENGILPVPEMDLETALEKIKRLRG